MTKTTRFIREQKKFWYDGVDSNCDGADDYDQDGDGYPIDGNDCNDEDNTIYAGAEDAWYDGVDSNCDGFDDYDQDGDGYVADEYTEVSVLEGGDCNDEDNTIYTGAEDVWYDGVDSNCDGADDYDQDGDGYVVDEYVESSSFEGGDCDDSDASFSPIADDVGMMELITTATVVTITIRMEMAIFIGTMLNLAH